MEWILQYWMQMVLVCVTSTLLLEYKKMLAIKLGVQALLRDRIYQAHDHYMQRGFLPIYARENIELLFVPYEALNGNGTAKTLVKEVLDLPTELKGGEHCETH